jgi:hypothetical protein
MRSMDKAQCDWDRIANPHNEHEHEQSMEEKAEDSEIYKKYLLKDASRGEGVIDI